MGISKLPEEVFTLIISNLEKRDKLTCIRVCRYWHDLIKSSCLYKTLVFIKNSSARLNKTYGLFREHEFLGKQVTQLDIQLQKYPGVDIMLVLPRLLPNLKSFNGAL